MIELLDESDPVVLHGYTNSNSGYADVRQTVAESVNERFGTAFTGENIVMTVGAAGEMCIRDRFSRTRNNEELMQLVKKTKLI